MYAVVNRELIRPSHFDTNKQIIIVSVVTLSGFSCMSFFEKVPMRM